MTEDSDIIVEMYQKDIQKIVRLSEEEFFLDENKIRESWESKMMFNIFE